MPHHAQGTHGLGRVVVVIDALTGTLHDADDVLGRRTPCDRRAAAWRSIRSTTPWGGGGDADALGHVTATGYDLLGRCIEL